MRRIVKTALSMIFFISLILGVVSMLFRTDFGVSRWLPAQYQWVVIVIIFAWWIGFIAWFIKDQMDN